MSDWRGPQFAALVLITGLAPPPLAAQEAVETAQAAPAAEDDMIVVSAERQRGAVLGDIPPQHSLDAAAIEGYAAADLSELIEELGPLVQGIGGEEDAAPVILLNGKRVSSFREIRAFPPEALERVDIFPEELALKYGFKPDQKVVNFVLRRSVRTVNTELQTRLATAGGAGIHEAEGSILSVGKRGRSSLDIAFRSENAIFESERDVSRASSRYDLVGNVGSAVFGDEVDPALSALAGEEVVLARLPSSALTGRPALEDFLASDLPPSPDVGRFRTLDPARRELSVNGSLNRTIWGDVDATINGRVEVGESVSHLGLQPVTLEIPAGNPFSPFAGDVKLYRYDMLHGPRVRESDSSAAHLGVILNGMIRPWRWTVTAEYDRTTSSTRTDAGLETRAFQGAVDAGDPSLNPFAPFTSTQLVTQLQNHSRSRSEQARVELVTNGPLADLPAGELSMTVKLGGDLRSLEGVARTNGLERPRDLERNRGTLQASIDVPVTSRALDSAIGKLAFNMDAEAEHFSDFGTLTSYGYGLSWSPVRSVRIVATVRRDEGAPSIQRLSDPVLVTPDSRVYDFVLGETVDVSRTTGGNPQLRSQSRRQLKLGLSARPWEKKQLTFNAEYVRNRTANPIASFPSVSPELEAAFPERFQRGPSGSLVAVDARPLNFARRSADTLRWGVRLSQPFGAQPAPRRPAVREGGPNGTRRGRRAGRIQASLHHKWWLRDELLVVAAGPTLDFLDGAAAGDSGGRPRHEIEAKLAVSRSGLTARATGRWKTGSTVGGAGGQGTLFFSDLATLDLSLSANLGRQPGLQRHAWLRGARLTIGVRNIFDERLRVRDDTGATPVRYLPDVLDPFGRSVRISLRKLFR